MTRSLAPVNSSTNNTCFHVRPPPGVLKTPRSAFGPKRCPCAAMYTTFSSVGSMTMRATERVSLRPMFDHVFPPSVDLYTPSPQLELWRVLASPVPTHTVSGADGATATAPMDIIALTPSKTGDHETPLFELFQTPPLAVATYT